jgi:hypothetical protein
MCSTSSVVQSATSATPARSNALYKGLIALRRFNLPVRSRLRSHRSIKNRLVLVWASESNPRFEVQRWVECDPVDPGAKFGLAAKRLERVVNLEKYLLRHVFRFWNELPTQKSKPRGETREHDVGEPVPRRVAGRRSARGYELESLSIRVSAQAWPARNGRQSGPCPKE